MFRIDFNKTAVMLKVTHMLRYLSERGHELGLVIDC